MSQNATEDWNDVQQSEGDEEVTRDYSDLFDSSFELVDSSSEFIDSILPKRMKLDQSIQPYFHKLLLDIYNNDPTELSKHAKHARHPNLLLCGCACTRLYIRS